jgi:2-polyprenyl-6-methoxyphenol hydroxylase-like FAD-dependent oxidoreductase
LSGLGTALALHGAETLATALLSGRPQALEEYEQAMRPRVEAAQKMFPGRVAMYAPRTRSGIRVMTGMMRLVQTRPVSAALGRLVATHGQNPAGAAR